MPGENTFEHETPMNPEEPFKPDESINPEIEKLKKKYNHAEEIDNNDKHTDTKDTKEKKDNVKDAESQKDKPTVLQRVWNTVKKVAKTIKDVGTMVAARVFLGKDRFNEIKNEEKEKLNNINNKEFKESNPFKPIVEKSIDNKKKKKKDISKDIAEGKYKGDATIEQINRNIVLLRMEDGVGRTVPMSALNIDPEKARIENGKLFLENKRKPSFEIGEKVNVSTYMNGVDKQRWSVAKIPKEPTKDATEKPTKQAPKQDISNQEKEQPVAPKEKESEKQDDKKSEKPVEKEPEKPVEKTPEPKSNKTPDAKVPDEYVVVDKNGKETKLPVNKENTEKAEKQRNEKTADNKKAQDSQKDESKDKETKQTNEQKIEKSTTQAVDTQKETEKNIAIAKSTQELVDKAELTRADNKKRTVEINGEKYTLQAKSNKVELKSADGKEKIETFKANDFKAGKEEDLENKARTAVNKIYENQERDKQTRSLDIVINNKQTGKIIEGNSYEMVITGSQVANGEIKVSGTLAPGGSIEQLKTVAQSYVEAHDFTTNQFDERHLSDLMQDAINTKQVETIEVTGAGTINTSELEANEPAFEAFGDDRPADINKINLERNEFYYQPDDLNRDGVVEEGERDDDNDGVPNKYDEEEEDFDDDFGERSLF